MTGGVTATSLNAGAGTIAGGSLNVTNDITAGGNITGKAITGTSLALSGDITDVGAITAAGLPT